MLHTVQAAGGSGIDRWQHSSHLFTFYICCRHWGDRLSVHGSDLQLSSDFWINAWCIHTK